MQVSEAPAQEPVKQGPRLSTAPVVTQEREWPVSSGNWGGAGLLQTPSSRMNRVSTFGVHFHRASPFGHANLLLQPFEDLEWVLRYTSVSSLPYGPLAPDRAYMDKSMEVKWRAHKELALLPELSVGLRDPLGTGLFSGEYVVAGKNFGPLDASLGLGWGYLGSRGHFKSPLAVLDPRLASRQSPEVGQGGRPRTASWFSGPVSPFAGIQWKTPYQPLVVKLEYEGHKNKPSSGGFYAEQKSPFNAGLLWRWGVFDLGLSWERGQRLGLNLGWMIDGGRIQPMQVNPAPEPVARSSSSAPDHAQAMEAWRQHTGWRVSGLDQQGQAYIVAIDNPGGTFAQERLAQGLEVLDQHAPAEVQKFVFNFSSHSVPITRFEVARPRSPQSAEQRSDSPPAIERVPHPQAQPEASGQPLYRSTDDRLSTKLDADYDQSVGGPDGYLFALSARARGRLDLWPGAWMNGSAHYRLIDNYDKISYVAPSGLPRVRTDLPDYLKASRLTLPRLQLNQLAQWGPNLYGLGYAGLLERMYAGAGFEMLYRPDGAHYGVGWDINAVRQRGYSQQFKMRAYEVTTGHVNAYWDTRWHGLQLNLAAGRYLAGDKGATLELARVFPNGIAMGAWLTRTTASAAQFGEGSFDKGVFLSIPLDLPFKGVAGVGSLIWQPLVRDGGARLSRGNTLWGLTRMRDARAMEYSSRPLH